MPWAPSGFNATENVDLRQVAPQEVGSETAMLKTKTSTVAAVAGVATFAAAVKPCYATGAVSGRQVFSLKD